MHGTAILVAALDSALDRVAARASGLNPLFCLLTPMLYAPLLLHCHPMPQRFISTSSSSVAARTGFYCSFQSCFPADFICHRFDFPSPWWDNISKGAKNLVTKLLELNPTKRLTAEQVRI